MEHRHIGTTVLYCDVRGIPSSWFEGTSFTGDGQGIENRAFEKPVPFNAGWMSKRDARRKQRADPPAPVLSAPAPNRF